MLFILSTEPNTVSYLIDTNKETVPLLPSVDNTEISPKFEPSDVDKEQNNEVKVSSTTLVVFGSVDEISNIVSAADLSATALNLFPWESRFVGDFLFLERRLIY